ncbi:MAG: hypothetical protein ABIT37_05715 [Luteolibacter sp.]
MRCQCGYDRARVLSYSTPQKSGSTLNRVVKVFLIIIGILILILAIVFAACAFSLRGINGV